MGWSKIFSLLMENDAQNDARKQLERENLVKDAGPLGGGVETDPDAIAKVASNTPYTDSTFDANNINRVRPVNPALDKQSQFKATDFANKYNTQQQSAESADAREMADLPIKTKIQQDAITNAYKDKQLFDQNQLLGVRAAALGNQRDSWAYYTPQDSDIPAQDKIDALADINKYGAEASSKGYTGAELGQSETAAKTDETKARADYYRARPTEPTAKPSVHVDPTTGNLTIVDGDTVIKHEKIIDPKTLQPTGYKVTKTDLKTGATFEQNPFKGGNSPNSTLGPTNKSRAVPVNTGPSILNRIKGAAENIDPSQYDMFNLKPLAKSGIENVANGINNFKYENADAIQGVKDMFGNTIKGVRNNVGDKVYQLGDMLDQLLNARGRKQMPPPAE